MVTQTAIRKIIPFEVKEVSPRVLEFVGSTEDKDRMGDIIVASGWQLKNYKKNPVFMWAHQYDMPPVGKAVKVWTEEDRLKFHIQFPTREEYEFADTIYKLYKGGYLRASSVGFMPLESELIETKEDEIFLHPPTRYLKQDLLELSGCPVPANPNALAEAKIKGLITAEDALAIAMAKVIDEEKPYPNEHACRLKAPDDFKPDSFRRTKRQHEGKEYSIIMGRLKGEDTMTEQAYRYEKEIWTAKQASSHCKDHDGTFEPATSEGKDIKSAISYQSAHLTGTPKAPEDEKWEEKKKEITEKAIADELDFVLNLLSGRSFNPENTERLWEIVRGIMGFRGSQIPLDIAEKIGAVLNKANRERLEKIRVLAQEVLDSAEREEEPEKSAEITPEQIVEIVQEAVADIIRQAQGKLKKR